MILQQANINLSAITKTADYYREQGFTCHSGSSETTARKAVVKRYLIESFMLSDTLKHDGGIAIISHAERDFILPTLTAGR
jgi:hypothetical protein